MYVCVYMQYVYELACLYSVCLYSIVFTGDPLGHVHIFERLLQLLRFQALMCPFYRDLVVGTTIRV